MIGYELKLMLNRDKGYLVSDKAMSIERFDLPDFIKAFKLSYWLIKVLDYDSNRKEIFCEVISYEAGNGLDDHQIQLTDKLREVESVRFRGTNTVALMKSSYKAHKEFPPIRYKEADPRPTVHSDIGYIYRPQNQTINTNFFIPIKDIEFKSSCVSIEKKIDMYYKPIELIIKNDDIKEEYDAVKNYFANVLRTKKIQVFVNIEITDNEITLLDVKSPEIDKITKQLIDEVRINFVKSNIKKLSNQENDKTLFTADEFFENLTDGISTSKIFYSNEKDFLEDLIKISNSKHYNHLRYLSSKHAHDIIKLRFAQKPLSYIFLVSGHNNYHFIWETLDTEEATYVWSVEKNLSQLKSSLQNIEEAIKRIKEHGKKVYLNSIKEKPNRIFHDYTDSKKSFEKWKEDLNLILT